jgi:hypothetical protein
MKKIYFIGLFIFLVFFFTEISLAEYYQCRIMGNPIEGVDYGYGAVPWVKHGREACFELRGRAHICQIYDYDLNQNQMQEYCENYCLKRSNFPKDCVEITLEPSTNIEAHQLRVASENQSIKDKILNLFKKNEDKVPTNLKNLFQKEEEKELEEQIECLDDEILINNECVYRCEFDQIWNGKQCIAENIPPNTYQVFYEDNVKLIKFTDINGNEKWTKDGKKYYDSKSYALNPPLIKKTSEFFSDKWKGFKSALFETKFKDKDQEMQRVISREVISNDDDKEKIEEKYRDVLSKTTDFAVPNYLSDLVSVPADSIKEFSKEADKTEFTQGAMIYIKERETRSVDNIYQNPPEELVYGGFKGVGQNINNKYEKSVLYAKYEEVYQKYKIQKELENNFN